MVFFQQKSHLWKELKTKDLKMNLFQLEALVMDQLLQVMQPKVEINKPRMKTL